MDDSISNTPGKMVSFMNEGAESELCEICLEPFIPGQRLPKILPCGHNFCESCLFSLCCHSEYYLLDSINCPTCRRQFSMKEARSAGTNYSLCKVLERNANRASEQNNVTVIYVGTDRKTVEKMTQGRHAEDTSIISEDCRRLAHSTPVKAKAKRCTDCRRKILTKHLEKLARFCEDCSNAAQVQLSCLECCVNQHNGHKIYSISQLEKALLLTLQEVREIRRKTLEASEQFDSRLEEIQLSSARIECPSIIGNKMNVLNEALSAIDETIKRLESNRLHPTNALRNMRDIQYTHYTRVSKMNSVLEKSVIELPDQDCTTPAFKRGLGRIPSSTSSSQLRQSKLTMRSDESLVKESISCLVVMLPTDEHVIELEETFNSISPRDTIEQRKRVYMDCTRILTQILFDDVHLPPLFMFADCFLNCFYQLHVLSRKRHEYGTETRKISRQEVWKCIQKAYSELLRVAAKQFPSYHPERIDVIDDLAYLCHLYADVCDQASVTICMIEAARARAADGNLSDADRQLGQQRLKLIDEHLLECRRVQKLNELRTTKSRDKRRGIKRLFSCMRPRVAA